MVGFTREPYIIIIAYVDGGKMKRIKKKDKKVIIVFFVVLGLMTAGYFIWMYFAIRPLKDLSVNNVEKISIFSCGEEKELNEEETEKVINFLRKAVCYKAENIRSFEYDVGGSPYIIKMADKTQLIIEICSCEYDTVPRTRDYFWDILEINGDVG